MSAFEEAYLKAAEAIRKRDGALRRVDEIEAKLRRYREVTASSADVDDSVDAQIEADLNRIARKYWKP